LRIDVLTLFPEMFAGVLGTSILKRAQEKGLLEVNLVNIRDFSRNPHRAVDDYPYGGGPGMILQAEPIVLAAESVRGARGGGGSSRLLLMSPQGELLKQRKVKELAAEKHLIVICGHYEGIDERVRLLLSPEEISIGDYVLTGGELPAMVLIDAVTRLLPGVLGESAGGEEESFYAGLLEFPQYTRPREYRGLKVPEVLLSGHHEMIRRWRRRQSLLRTWERRPDLLAEAEITEEEREWLFSLASQRNIEEEEG